MLIGAILNGANLEQKTTIGFQSENVTVNEETGRIQMQPINLPSLLLVGAIIGIALAVCLVAGVQVLGSGISGSAIPILFLVTIMTSVFTLLSLLSFPVFSQIPYIGLPLYFSLVICYVIGVATIGVASAGD